MSDTAQSKFKVGDLVWNAHCTWLPVSQPCPICYEKREVTLILGNGDLVVLLCDYCGKGYEGPKGTVDEYEYVVEPEPVHITSITLEVSADKTVAKYHAGCRYYDEENLFPTKEEAMEKGKELKMVLEVGRDTRVECIKKSTSKSFSWNAGYHMREAKRSRKDAERHEKLAVICKARSRTAEEEGK